MTVVIQVIAFTIVSIHIGLLIAAIVSLMVMGCNQMPIINDGDSDTDIESTNYTDIV